MNAKMEDLEVNERQQQKSKISIPAKDKKLHLQFIQEKVSVIVKTINLDFSCVIQMSGPRFGETS